MEKTILTTPFVFDDTFNIKVDNTFNGPLTWDNSITVRKNSQKFFNDSNKIFSNFKATITKNVLIFELATKTLEEYDLLSPHNRANANARLNDECDDYIVEQPVAFVKGHYFNVSVLQAFPKESLLKACSVHNGYGPELCDLYRAFFHGNDIKAEFNEPINQVLYLHTMSIEKEYLHQGMGLSFIDALMKGAFLPNHTAVVLKIPFLLNEPLPPPPSWEPLAQFEAVKRSDSLNNYFRSVNFKTINEFHYKVTHSPRKP